MPKNKQTVSVLDERDTVIGHTYPRRAKGLVKKCRAKFVSDNVIRLHRQCPTYENMEDKEMDHTNFITIHPAIWRKNPDGIQRTVCDRFMISNPLFGAVASAPSMVEVLSIGAWNREITSYVTNGFQQLMPNTEYHFVFWLNGGENDRNDEVCMLQILFTDDTVTASNSEFDEGMRFRLNRGYIKPLKKYMGWEYYDLPFTTTQAKYTQFQFVAHKAPMALMDAGEPDLYKDVPDVVDPYEKLRPQRHNIIFEDGWPVNVWYATEKLAQKSTEDHGKTMTNESWKNFLKFPEKAAGPGVKDIPTGFNQMANMAVNKVMKTLEGLDLDRMMPDIERTAPDLDRAGMAEED